MRRVNRSRPTTRQSQHHSRLHPQPRTWILYAAETHMISPHDIYRIKDGNFAEFEAVVTSRNDDEVTVTIEIFGQPTTLEFPVAAFDEHLEPFADIPAQDLVEEPAAFITELRRHHPTANAIYATHWVSFPICGSIQLSHSADTSSVVVWQLNMTSPISSDNWQTVTNDSVPNGTWHTFLELIDRCSFWSLAHDDGRRLPKRERAHHYHFEGWNGEEYHSVIRQTSEDNCCIEPLCRFLANLAPDAGYAA